MKGDMTSQPEISASIRHLKLFESVARLNGVRRASEECHLSQPAVTQAIAKLEEQLGIELFDRRASGSYLNEYGVIFQRRTQRLFEQFEQALVELGVPNGLTPTSVIPTRITRPQIRSLIAIVENHSFAQAARALDISQTSLQRAARDLERTLRTPLYVQTASGIMATPAGVEFARKIKLAMREVELGIEELEAAKGNDGGEIVIGAMLLSGSVVLATVLNEFVQQYPNANIRVLNGNAEDMLTCLRTGEVDFVIGLLRDPAPSGLTNVAIAETPYVVVARPDHPLTQKPRVTREELAEYEWVVGTPGSSRLMQFNTMFAGRAKPLARVATGSLPTIRLMLANSDRLTLLTSFELIHEGGQLVALSYPAIAPAPFVGVTMRQNWLPTKLQANFLELIQKQVVGAINLPKGLTRSRRLKIVSGSRP